MRLWTLVITIMILYSLPAMLVADKDYPARLSELYPAQDSLFIKLKLDNNCGESVSQFDDLCEKGNNDACLELAKYYYAQGVYLRAKRTLKNTPNNNTAINYWLGQLCLILEQPDSAIDYFHKAKFGKLEKFAKLGLGDAYHRLGNDSLAEVWYNQADLPLTNPESGAPEQHPPAGTVDNNEEISDPVNTETGVESEDNASPTEPSSDIANTPKPSKDTFTWKGWTIQFGAFSDRKNAESLLKRVKNEIFPVKIYESKQADRRTYHLVWGGIFSNEASAKERAEHLSDDFIFTIKKIEE